MRLDEINGEKEVDELGFEKPKIPRLNRLRDGGSIKITVENGSYTIRMSVGDKSGDLYVGDWSKGEKASNEDAIRVKDAANLCDDDGHGIKEQALKLLQKYIEKTGN